MIFFLTGFNQLRVFNEKMTLHVQDVLVGQGENFTVRRSFNSKMSFHLAHACVPFFNVDIVFIATCNDIDNSEAITWTNGYILGMLKSWQHIR